MRTREDVLKSDGYWIAQWQVYLFSEIQKYMTEHKMTQQQLANKIGVTKGYVSQILNGNFDHKISKLVKLSLAIQKVPIFKMESLETYIEKNLETQTTHLWVASSSSQSTQNKKIQINTPVPVQQPSFNYTACKW